MGILYNSMKKVQLHQEMKRRMIIDRILDCGVKEYQGKSLLDLDYEDLKTLLVLAEMRKVDIEHPDHRWFR